MLARSINTSIESLPDIPLGAVRRIYEAAGRELTAAVETRMRAFLAENPRDKHGAHTYAAEDFRIDVPARRASLRFYAERFGVPLEGEG